MKYQIIYADPPWRYYAGGNRNATRYYNCMEIQELCHLPVVKFANDDCVLFLWTTYPILDQSFNVIKAWGFNYSTVAFTWVKLNKNNMGFFIGCGYWTRANAELCLLATRGHPRRVHKDVPQIIATPRMAHSRKPDEVVRDRIIRLCGDLPRIELFARRKVEGWDCWGNEVASDIELEVRK